MGLEMGKGCKSLYIRGLRLLSFFASGEFVERGLLK